MHSDILSHCQIAARKKVYWSRIHCVDMASTHPAIHLQVYPTATPRIPPSTSTHQNTSNQQASTSGASPSVATSSSGLQYSANAPPTFPPQQYPPASSAQAAKFRERQWKAFKGWSGFFVKSSLAIAGLFATYLALSLSMWTSMKDYREDFRSQNVRKRAEWSVLSFLLTHSRAGSST